MASTSIRLTLVRNLRGSEGSWNGASWAWRRFTFQRWPGGENNQGCTTKCWVLGQGNDHVMLRKWKRQGSWKGIRRWENGGNFFTKWRWSMDDEVARQPRRLWTTVHVDEACMAMDTSLFKFLNAHVPFRAQQAGE